MRAACYERLGDPFDVLRITDMPDPEAGPGEVRVRLAVSGVNPSDGKHRSGWTGATAPLLPIIPHQDGAGIIDQVGAGVAPDRIGEKVWIFEARGGGRHAGTAAQYVTLPSSRAVPLPDSASLDLGACLGVPALTAHRCLFADGPIAGQTILIAGGAGSVGRSAVQLARWGGARVIATAGNAGQAATAEHAGAHHALLYTDPETQDRIMALAPEGVDRIVEVALATNVVMDIAVARHGGTITSYASPAGPDDTLHIPARAALAKALTLRWVHVYSMAEEAKLTAIHDISEALRDGALTLPPVRRFPLERIAEAHAAIGISGAGGKILIDIP